MCSEQLIWSCGIKKILPQTFFHGMKWFADAFLADEHNWFDLMLHNHSLVNSSNLLCKLLCFFFIYRHGKSCVLNNWFDLMEYKNFFLNFFHGMKWFADSFSIHLHFFFSVDLWSRSRFPIYYQHHQSLLIWLKKEISVRLIYFHINYCWINDISPFKTNSFSFL